MGNEETQVSSTPGRTFEYESIILVRGSRKSGKSTLISRMRGRPFNPSYETTNQPISCEIPWKTDSGQSVKLKIWDVSEHYFTSNPRRQRDPKVVSTLQNATGLIILLDSRDSESVQLADKLLGESPETLQIVVFSNFADEEGVLPLIPERLQRYIGTFYFIPGSLKTNLGLIELSKWIKLPLTAAKRRMYADKFRVADETLRDLSEKLNATAKLFQTETIARSHMPELRTKPPEPVRPVVTAQPAGNQDEMHDKEFWGEASQKRKPLHKRKRTVQQETVEAKPKPPIRRQMLDARADVLPREEYDTI
jgi:hypothetical protein